MRTLRLFTLLLLCVCTVVSFAQTNTTGLSGTIIDPSGALISGAGITLTNAATGLTKATQSGEKGEYSFDQILPGTYTVTVSSPGFSNSVRKVTLLVATPLQLNIKMEIGTTEVVNVDASSTVLNVADASLGTPFSSQQVQTLPYQANNVLSLLSLQAGVLSLDPGAQTGGYNSTDQRTGAVNGARQDQSNVTLDGLDNNDQNNGYAFNGVLRSTRESVQEFRVTTGNANADAGRSSGAQVSLVTRSGTNDIHGSAYYLYRGPATASNTWFLKQSQLVKKQPNTAAKVLQDTFGASLGGPILKNKLFFFGAYEGFKQASDVVVSQTVPSVLSPAAGVPTTSDGYAGLVTGTVTYVPTTGGTKTLYSSDITAMDNTGRGVDPAAVAYFNQYPRANSASLGDLYNTGGYVFSSPNPISQITNIGRLDYNVSSRQILFLRGNLQSDNSTGTYQFLQSGQVPATRVYSNNKGLAAGWIWTLSNTATNNFRYGLTRQNAITLGAVQAGYVTISGLTSLYPSGTSANSSTYREPVHDFVDDFTLVKGRHTIQFGMNDRLLLNNRYTNASLFPTGSISVSLLTNAGVAGLGQSFDPGAFGYPTVASSFRTSYNNAILADAGAITSSTQYLNYTLKNGTMTPIPAGQTLPTRHFKNFEQEYYVQDQWKVTPTITVTGGLRYVYLQAPYETSGQEIAPTIGMDAFLKNRTTAAAAGSAYNTRITYVPAGKANNAPDYWSPQTGNFAPRVAVAWSPNGKYSIRAGYGLAFDHFGDSIVNAFDASGGFKLNSSTTNSYGSIDNSPRFSGYNTVPTTASTSTPLTLPYTPPDNSFNFTSNINRDQKTPYAQTLNLTVEAEVHHGLTVSAGYVGRFGRHLLASWDASQPSNLYDAGSGMTYFQAMDQIAKLADAGTAVSAVPNMQYWQDMFPKASFTYKTGSSSTTYTGTQAIYAKEFLGDDVGNETDILYQYDVLTSGAADGSTFRYFYPQYGSMFAQSTIGTSSYNGGQLTVHQATRYGVQFDFNYTYAKSMDLGSYPERSGTSYNRISNTLNPSGNYGPSDFDVRHNITANWVANSPFGKGGLFFTSPGGVLERIIGGWQLTGVLHFSTGMPWTATSSVYGTNFAASTQMIATAPIATNGHHRYVANGTSSYETVFANDTPTSAYGKLRFVYPGEAGQRNNFRADGYMDMDSGLAKDFRTFHEQNLHIGVEAFNVLNSVRFNTLTTNATSGSFGKYSSLLVNPRQMQFTAKYTF